MSESNDHVCRTLERSRQNVTISSNPGPGEIVQLARARGIDVPPTSEPGPFL